MPGQWSDVSSSSCQSLGNVAGSAAAGTGAAAGGNGAGMVRDTGSCGAGGAGTVGCAHAAARASSRKGTRFMSYGVRGRVVTTMRAI